MSIVISVVGASGGVGTTTLAALLAWVAGVNAPTVLVDADPRIGAIDVTCGVEHVDGLRWPDLSALRGSADGPALVARLPRTTRYAVLASAGPDVPAEVVRGVVDALATAADTVVLDAGRTPDPGLLDRSDVVLVVTGLGVRHLADAERAVDRVGRTRPTLLVTRGSRRLARLAAPLAAHLGLEHVTHWSDDPRLPRQLEVGLAPGTRGDRQADRILALVDEARGSGKGPV